VADLEARLTNYLMEVNAQLAQPNPDYDPAKADDATTDERRGGKGGKQGKETQLNPAMEIRRTAWPRILHKSRRYFTGHECRRDGAAGRTRRQKRGGGEGRMPTLAFRTDVPAHPVDLILGRPTTEAVTLSVLSYTEREGYVAYGFDEKSLPTETSHPGLAWKDQPVEIGLAGLQANTPVSF